MPSVNAELRSGSGPWTQVGCVNDNMQKNHGTRGCPGNHYNQYAYKLECLHCGFCYGANGVDIHERKCPNCQGGAPSIEY